MAITIKHLIQEARAQGCPARLIVNGREFKVEIIHGTPHVTVDRMPRSQVVGQELLDFAYLVESAENKKQETPQAVTGIYQMLIIRDRVCGKQVQDVGGTRFQVDRDELGQPEYLVNGIKKTRLEAQTVLSTVVSRIPGARIDNEGPPSPSLHIQVVGRSLRQPRNEGDVYNSISLLLEDLSGQLSEFAKILEDGSDPCKVTAVKIRQLLHLNKHGTLPLATD